MLFLRVYAPEALADEVASSLGAVDGVRHLARAPLAEPGATMVTADVEPGSVDAALGPSSDSTSRPMTCSSRGSPSSDLPGATARSPGTRTP